MSSSLLELDDRYITDTGSVAVKHKLLVNMALNGLDFSELMFAQHDDITRYHMIHGTGDSAKQWIKDDNVMGPSLKSYDWNIPEDYKNIDVVDYCYAALSSMGLPDEYEVRLDMEMIRVAETSMEPFIRCLIYITDSLRDNNIVWGLGRGSSCASLVMFLIGANKVDPVKYDIPMEEFYK